jgi:hypothetical protein
MILPLPSSILYLINNSSRYSDAGRSDLQSQPENFENCSQRVRGTHPAVMLSCRIPRTPYQFWVCELVSCRNKQKFEKLA